MVNTTVPLARRFLDGRAERAPPVGWFHVFHRADLAAVAPRWLHFCGRMRTEPQRYWNVDGHGEDIPTGDLYVERGRPPSAGRAPNAPWGFGMIRNDIQLALG
jgi:hypothetical protein